MDTFRKYVSLFCCLTLAEGCYRSKWRHCSPCFLQTWFCCHAQRISFKTYWFMSMPSIIFKLRVRYVFNSEACLHKRTQVACRKTAKTIFFRTRAPAQAPGSESCPSFATVGRPRTAPRQRPWQADAQVTFADVHPPIQPYVVVDLWTICSCAAYDITWICVGYRCICHKLYCFSKCAFMTVSW